MCCPLPEDYYEEIYRLEEIKKRENKSVDEGVLRELLSLRAPELDQTQMGRQGSTVTQQTETDPPHILDPNIELDQYVIQRQMKINKKNDLSCDSCGKALNNLYYVSFGVPPSPLIIETYECRSLNYEKEMDQTTMSYIRGLIIDTSHIDSKFQWIFSEQNIMSSKTRMCVDCKQKYKWRAWRNYDMSMAKMQRVCFAVEEYQRQHTPIKSTMSDFEKYIISLPDRSKVHWVHCPFDPCGLYADLQRDNRQFTSLFTECLEIALNPESKTSNLDLITLIR